MWEYKDQWILFYSCKQLTLQQSDKPKDIAEILHNLNSNEASNLFS